MANAVDREFLSHTIPHHRQGVQMGELAAERASRDDVRTVARKTAEDQRKDIERLEALLPAVGLTADDVEPADSESAAMEAMIAHVRQQEGLAFDASFLAMMMNHHMGAMGLAALESAAGEVEELTSMASSTQEKQMEELDTMRELLATVSSAAR